MGWNEREYFVYMLASRSRVLYVGVTNDLQRRVWEHRNGAVEGFTKRYNIHRLVWFESGSDVVAAIEREKQLKGWRREKKIALIEEGNPTWEDLAEGWFDGSRSEKQIPHFVRDDNETIERNDSGELAEKGAKDQSFGN